jgi:gluconokinase
MATDGRKAGNATPFGLFRYAVDRERTVIGGAVSNAGNLRHWCVREFRIDDAEKALSRTAAASDALTVLPFWVGERAPSWPENLRGALIGLSQASSASEILRATTCAVFYRLGEILDLIETCAGRAREVIVSGGILRSPASIRLLADALGRDLRVSPVPEASLRGAAVYALGALGCQVDPLPKGRIARYDRALAKKHRVRRECQIALEELLSW